MAQQSRNPAEMAATMRKVSQMMLLAAGSMAVIGVVLLVVLDQKLPGLCVLLVAVLDLGMVAFTRTQAQRAQRQADARPGIQEL